ncbi:hypothetical protein, partial [Methanosarcina sp.]|uniref:hypothetical protein n=1 Tax=Methanosarcina sp. TaxID=2213 RepID=UPI002D1FA76F
MYLLTLAAVFTGLLFSTSFVVHGEEESAGFEQGISDSPFLENVSSNSGILCSGSSVLKPVNRESGIIPDEGTENVHDI